jgi:hypothetical protein
MELTKYLTENTHARCIVENTAGSTITYSCSFSDNSTTLYVVPSKLPSAAHPRTPFPFPQVKLVRFGKPDLFHIIIKNQPTGYIVTDHEFLPASCVYAYLRGRIEPSGANEDTDVGPDGFVWILTINPEDEIAESSIAQIKEFIGDPMASFNQQWSPAKQVSTTKPVRGCAIS